MARMIDDDAGCGDDDDHDESYDGKPAPPLGSMIINDDGGWEEDQY